MKGATGSHRWRICVDGTGGHSYADFGHVPSAIHAICRAGAKIADFKVPEDPKTTFTIGTIKGGTTVNSIAAHCEVEVDMRSVNNEALLQLEAAVLKAFDEAVDEEKPLLECGRRGAQAEAHPYSDRQSAGRYASG